MLEYKYEYLFKLFPELELYIENLDEIENIDNIDDLKGNTDRARFYLEKEEWEKLPANERNQLALDRYIQRKKSKWQIGRDYEMFIGYEYTKCGWDVEYIGIYEKLEDMGRDLIARKEFDTHIIQCKYWSKNKTIHEKHICQLYGTTIQYKIENNNLKKVIPVLITNIKLSEKAKLFANFLKVKVVEDKDFKEFPRIKCNLNKDENGELTKIYHLPMDQQYDKTKINAKGECFAWTVNEAVSKGFRRAKKYFSKTS